VSCCVEELMPPSVEEPLVPDEVSDDVSVDDVPPVGVFAFLGDGVDGLAVAECATPPMRTAVSATPATALEPPTTAARRMSRFGLSGDRMPTTIGRRRSASPHSNVKESSRPGECC
jgi:hypothetical protein